MELGPKLEYKVGRTIARVTLHEFGQTGYHPGITDSVKAHVEACERNKARCGPHDQDICKPIKDVSAISRRKLAKTIDSLMCSVTVVGQQNVRRESPAVEESYLSREY